MIDIRSSSLQLIASSFPAIHPFCQEPNAASLPVLDHGRWSEVGDAGDTHHNKSTQFRQWRIPVCAVGNERQPNAACGRRPCTRGKGSRTVDDHVQAGAARGGPAAIASAGVCK